MVAGLVKGEKVGVLGEMEGVAGVVAMAVVMEMKELALVLHLHKDNHSSWPPVHPEQIGPKVWRGSSLPDMPCRQDRLRSGISRAFKRQYSSYTLRPSQF